MSKPNCKTELPNVFFISAYYVQTTMQTTTKHIKGGYNLSQSTSNISTPSFSKSKGKYWMVAKEDLYNRNKY